MVKQAVWRNLENAQQRSRALFHGEPIHPLGGLHRRRKVADCLGHPLYQMKEQQRTREA